MMFTNLVSIRKVSVILCTAGEVGYAVLEIRAWEGD